jgi:hypothetical protein
MPMKLYFISLFSQVLKGKSVDLQTSVRQQYHTSASIIIVRYSGTDRDTRGRAKSSALLHAIQSSIDSHERIKLCKINHTYGSIFFLQYVKDASKNVVWQINCMYWEFHLHLQLFIAYFYFFCKITQGYRGCIARDCALLIIISSISNALFGRWCVDEMQ